MDYNKLSLNLKDNAEWAAALAGASAGDTITLKEVKVLIDELATDMCVGSVEECEGITVTPGPDSGNKGASGEASEEAVAPVLSVMVPNYQKKK